MLKKIAVITPKTSGANIAFLISFPVKAVHMVEEISHKKIVCTYGLKVIILFSPFLYTTGLFIRLLMRDKTYIENIYILYNYYFSSILSHFGVLCQFYKLKILMYVQ